jgi:hypothetical protein
MRVGDNKKTKAKKKIMKTKNNKISDDINSPTRIEMTRGAWTESSSAIPCHV